MEIRKAKSEDSAKLSQSTFAAKSYWKYPESWLELWKDALTITPEIILENEVFVMTKKNEIVRRKSGETREFCL